MVNLIKTCYHNEFHSEEFQNKLKIMIPSYGVIVETDKKLLKKMREKSEKFLGLV